MGAMIATGQLCTQNEALAEQCRPNARHGEMLGVRQDVAVGVQRDADLRVPQPLADQRQRHPVQQQERRVAVPEIMYANAGQASGGHDTGKVP